MEAAEGLPGIPAIEGTGGARKRMKFENSTMSLGSWSPERLKLVESSGVEFKRQAAGGLARSLGKSSLVTPISTL
jgi:hypothetical protein